MIWMPSVWRWAPGILTTFDAVVMTLMVVVKMIVYVDLKLTLLAMIPLLVILFGGSRYGTAISRRYEKKQAAFGKLTDFVQESVSGIRVLKAFVQDAQDYRAFDQVARENQKANLQGGEAVRVIAAAGCAGGACFGADAALRRLFW